MAEIVRESNNSDILIGANSIVYIVKYIALDGTLSAYTSIGGPEITSIFSSFTFSAYAETKPVFSLGKSVAPRYVTGPLIIRGKCTFTSLNDNELFRMTDFYLKSMYNTDGTLKGDFDELGENSVDYRGSEVISNIGAINAVTTNPFDVWIYTHGMDGDTRVTSLFGVQIDTSTVVKDANNPEFNIAEFNAINFNEKLPGNQADKILWANDYSEYIRGIVNSQNQRGRLPFR